MKLRSNFSKHGNHEQYFFFYMKILAFLYAIILGVGI